MPPCWDLDIVLRHLMSEAYEPLSSPSLWSLTKKTLFLVTLAMAKRVGELQALLKVVSFQGDDLILSYLPHFIAKTERADAPLPRSFCLCSLSECAGDLEEGSVLCPVRALRTYLERTKLFPMQAATLFLLVLRLVRCRRTLSRTTSGKSSRVLGLSGELKVLL